MPTDRDNHTSQTARPWYADGLRFTCRRCGDCCRGEPGFVWIRPEEIEAAARFLGMRPADFRRRFVRRAFGRLSLIELPNGDCIMWSTEGCRIYPHRPSQCRTFPFWTEYLRTPLAWEAAQRRCRGCGIGKLHSLDEIRKMLAER